MLSIEADLMPLGGDDDADLIDGVMGEGSQFHEEFGIYGQGVSIETAVLPADWQNRLVPLVDASTNAIGWCLDPHDLCAAKLIAGRAKDLEFVESAVVHRLIDPLLVEQRLAVVDDPRTDLARSRARGLEAKGLTAAERAKWHRQREMALTQRRENAPTFTWRPAEHRRTDYED